MCEGSWTDILISNLDGIVFSSIIYGLRFPCVLFNKIDTFKLLASRYKIRKPFRIDYSDHFGSGGLEG